MYKTALIILVLPFCLFSQAPSHYQLDFNKDYISYMWLARFQAAVKTGGQSEVSVNNQFSSVLFRQTAQIDKWRDENTFGFQWSTPFNSFFQPRTLIQSRIFSDENTNREFNKHVATEELVLNINPQIQVVPGLGYAMEKAFDSQDAGLHYRFGLDVTNLDMGGYYNYTDLQSNVYNFPGRKNQDHSFFTAWTRQFSNYASDSLRVGYQFSESRYYINPGTSGLTDPQEQVIIHARFLFNKLQYKMSESSIFSILTNFRNRNIDQSNPFPDSKRLRRELVIENQFEYILLLGPFNLLSNLNTSVTDNNIDPGLQADIKTLESAFNTLIQYQPSGNDKLWGRFSYTKLEYNTPNVFENTVTDPAALREDRDEQRFIFDAGYRRKLSSYFALTLKGNGYLFHQIYLRSGRSRNNNWNRIYQLTAAAEHQVGRFFRHRNQIQIMANYTIFDFEDLLANVQSFVFRKLIYTDSLGIHLSRNLSLNTVYQWEKEDNGRFFKDDFTQDITKELTAHFLNVYFQHNNIFGLRITSGISFFFRDEWSFLPERGRVKTREFRSITPRLTVVYPAGRKLLLYLTYAPNRTTNFGAFEQYYTSGAINLQYLF